MLTDDRSNSPLPWSLWRDAALKPAIDQAIRGIFEEIGAAIRQRGPVCWASGRCCNFNAYGHLLYVTGLEIAWFLSQLDNAGPHSDWSSRLEMKAPCPFQINSLCTTHAIRPLGCRIYFCQRGTEEWQHEVYETFQAKLRSVHDEHGLPYRYMEWRAGLMDARIAT